MPTKKTSSKKSEGAKSKRAARGKSASKTKSPSKPLAILLTGVPGCGKTTLAQSWCAREGWVHLDLNQLVEEHQLYSGIDEEDMAKVAQLLPLTRAANEAIADAQSHGRSIIVEGHLGCEIELDVSRVLVLRLHPDELSRRLQARGYTPSKIQTNKMTELLDYCVVQAIRNYGKANVFELDVSGKTPAQNLQSMAQFLSSSRPDASFKPHVDWSAELFKEVDVVQRMREGHYHANER